MSQTAPDAAASPLSLDVSFTFDTLWTIAPIIAPDNVPTALVPHFPPGGGLDIHPPPGNVDVNRIAIAPVHLAGLCPADVAQIVRQRAVDMSRIAQAITAAEIQFAEALQAASAC